MTEGAEITQKESFNDPSYHSELKNRYTNHIDYVSKARGIKMNPYLGMRRINI